MKLPLFKRKEETAEQRTIAAGDSVPAGFLASLKKGLTKTRSMLNLRIDELILGGKEISSGLLDELEEILITADIGVNTAHKLIAQVQSKIGRGEADNPHLVKQYLRESIYSILSTAEKPLSFPSQQPLVVMVVGVNGTGKTTTIAKMAHYYRALGNQVLLAAADTFRAAAIEQLEVWSRRIDCAFVKQSPGSDPSAVVHDAINAAVKRNSDMVIIDTAGRMHTRANLMEEIKKMRRVSGRACPGAPHETLLVIDATSGMNALSQARLFQEALEVTGIVLTKLDGTSKGGIIVSIADDFSIPISFVGIGEGLDDLKAFRAREFTDALFNEAR
jgi:fused signal recognition particle receptor